MEQPELAAPLDAARSSVANSIRPILLLPRPCLPARPSVDESLFADTAKQASSLGADSAWQKEANLLSYSEALHSVGQVSLGTPSPDTPPCRFSFLLLSLPLPLSLSTDYT